MTSPEKISRFYNANFKALCNRYSSLTFSDVHANLLESLPPPPRRVLDVGAGIGRDTLELYRLGYFVTACEPTKAFRLIGKCRSVDTAIVWVNDKLPYLNAVLGFRSQYDVILVSAVWMHLSETERLQSLATIKKLLTEDGFAYITYRSKSVDIEDIYFDLSVVDFKMEIDSSGLMTQHEFVSKDIEGRESVNWYGFIVRNKI